MRAPVPIGKTGPTGGYGAARGNGVYHWGLDISAKPGTDVVAPEDLEVIHVAINDTTPPLSGYGPGAILAQGASGLFHVLGHLDPWAWSGLRAPMLPYVGRRYAEGAWVGAVSKLNHVHWEVRRTELPPQGAQRGPLTLDPVALLQGTYASMAAPAAQAGSSELVLLLLGLYLLTQGSKKR